METLSLGIFKLNWIKHWALCSKFDVRPDVSWRGDPVAYGDISQPFWQVFLWFYDLFVEVLLYLLVVKYKSGDLKAHTYYAIDFTPLVNS